MTANLAASQAEAVIANAHAQACRASCESIHFRSLIWAKQRVIGSLLIITLGFFIGLMLLAGYAKDVMTTKLIGSFNVGYGLILAAYFVCWLGALLYVRTANREFDEKMKLVIKEYSADRARGE